MSMVIDRRTVLAGLAGTFALPVAAQTFPSRPVRLVVPFPAGGSTDVVARLVAEKLSQSLGQPVVVENRAGAGGTIGSEAVAKSPPDGYTLLLGTSSTHAVAPSLYPKLGYDPVRDFAPAVLIGTATVLVLVHPSVPVRNAAELITYAKANPSKLSYGSTGNGSISHLIAEYFKSAAGIQMQHVPYKGDSPLATDLLSGQVQVAFGTAAAFLQHVQSGKLRALAITDAKPSPIAPNLPTVAETVRDFEALQWFGFFAPAGTPRDVVLRMNGDINKVLQMRDVVDKLQGLGIAVSGGSPEQFATFLRGEAGKWAKIVKDSGAKVD
jgi:tripartite-type tricarboxylate transporter receptor subunit TctC